ncbi:uncharacterized protein LOC100681376 isoform X1 [Ornithorhynchus anatinus]|uniref:uncharacterized protein LOC100681376 isoform X1 n=1 Tax=Ornithorhynchus anatinus TaxID=9258 RepID=UPI000454412B|nr:uncharacterized protein LOC100681376 isoform X1 [Ornithorhynchus anatinus]
MRLGPLGFLVAGLALGVASSPLGKAPAQRLQMTSGNPEWLTSLEAKSQNTTSHECEGCCLQDDPPELEPEKGQRAKGLQARPDEEGDRFLRKKKRKTGSWSIIGKYNPSGINHTASNAAYQRILLKLQNDTDVSQQGADPEKPPEQDRPLKKKKRKPGSWSVIGRSSPTADKHSSSNETFQRILLKLQNDTGITQQGADPERPPQQAVASREHCFGCCTSHLYRSPRKKEEDAPRELDPINFKQPDQKES